MRVAAGAVAILASLAAGQPAVLAQDGRQAPQAAGADVEALIRRIRLCWSPPTGLPVRKITLRFGLQRDGSVRDEPVVVEPALRGTPLAASIVKAVKACQPYRYPAGAYAQFREIEAVFDAATNAQPRAARPGAASAPPPRFDPAAIERELERRKKERAGAVSPGAPPPVR